MTALTWFLIIWVIGMTGILITFYIQGKKAISIFPDIKTVKVIFRERSASGYSTRDFQSKMGGANKTLDIVVTDKELWLKSLMMLAGIGKRFDLIHKIPLENITNVTKEEQVITLNFNSENGERKEVIIKTKKPNDFLKAIKK